MGQVVDIKQRFDNEWQIDLQITRVDDKEYLIYANGLLAVTDNNGQLEQEYQYCIAIPQIQGVRAAAINFKVKPQKVKKEIEQPMIVEKVQPRAVHHCPHCQVGILEVLDKGEDGNTLMTCDKCAESCTLTKDGKVLGA